VIKKSFASGITAFCAVLALTACGNAESSGSGEINPDAQLTVAVNVMETSWDPARAVGVAAMPVMKLVFDGLLTQDKDGNVAPELATSWETTDGGLSYTFELRDDARFSNGDTFDAEDAKVTLERYRSFESSTLKGLMGNIDSITAVSPTELTIVQKRADVTLPVILAERAGIMMSADAIAEGDFEEPAGTGMFLLDSNRPGVSVTLKANPDYWDREAVKVAGVTVKKMEDTTARANALRSGDLDMSIVGANQITEIEGSSELRSYSVEGRALRGMTFNPDLYAPLEDQRVRDALSLAINREGLAVGVLLGEGKPASQFVPEGHKFFNDDAPAIPYDPDKARELLKQAGYEDSLSFTMTAPPKYQ